MNQTIEEKCRKLRLSAVAEAIPLAQKNATDKNWTPIQMLEYLLDLEAEKRWNDLVKRRFKQAKLPDAHTTDTFSCRDKSEVLERNLIFGN